ncbi:MerC domain-containing protein [Pseudoxanthomonas spadix]|nr:MerC domain-containing protein [Pseudoxanthomonas spadix]RMW95769.1 MerC domain-containing protein [Pseudoxanthomonas spadix]
MPSSPPSRLRAWLDHLGATGSLVCAAHCAVLPLLIALLPALGLSGWLGEGVEQAFVVFATLLGLFSLASSYRRHRALRALGMLLTGLVVLWTAVLYPPLHHSVVPHALAMTFGGTLVGLAHVLNLRLNHGHVHGPSCAHRPLPAGRAAVIASAVLRAGDLPAAHPQNGRATNIEE